MTKAMNTSPVARPAPAVATATAGEGAIAPLLITFVARRIGSEIQVRCRGCRELIPPNGAAPSQLRGAIELDGQSVPVIDANIRSRAEETEISHCSCVVVIERGCASQRLRVGMIVGDIDEVMQLAAGSLDVTVETEVTTQMHFVEEVFNAPNPDELLSELLYGAIGLRLPIAANSSHYVLPVIH